jgi:hypothetical protein
MSDLFYEEDLATHCALVRATTKAREKEEAEIRRRVRELVLNIDTSDRPGKPNQVQIEQLIEELQQAILDYRRSKRPPYPPAED